MSFTEKLLFNDLYHNSITFLFLILALVIIRLRALKRLVNELIYRERQELSVIYIIFKNANPSCYVKVPAVQALSVYLGEIEE